MTTIDFDILKLAPLSWAGFKRHYVGAIRPAVIWKKLKTPTMWLTLLLPGVKLYMVWYRNGDWRDGRPRTFTPGDGKAIVRIPAVLTRHGQLVALDGCHRLVEVKPAVVFIDWFKPRPGDVVYLNDLFNKEFA